METNSMFGENFGRAPRIRWLPLFIFALLAGLSFALSFFLHSKEQAAIKQSIQIQADFVLSQIHVDLKHRLATMNRLAREWNSPNEITKNEFTLDVTSILAEHPGFHAIEWVDTNYLVQWIVPYEGNEDVFNHKLNLEKKRRQTFEKALVLQEPTLSPAIQLIQGNQGILLVIPLFSSGIHRGFLVGVINPTEWMSHIIQSNLALSKDLNFQIQIVYDGTTLYRQAGFDSTTAAKLKMSSHSDILNRPFDIFVQPSPEYLHWHSNAFSKILLVISLLVSLLFSVIIHLLQKTSMESWLVKTSQKALEQEVENRVNTERELNKTLMRLDMATKAGGIGVWSWDISSSKLKWNEQMFHLFDYPQDISPTYETWRNSLHPVDLTATESLLRRAVEGKATFQTEFRIKLTDGTIRHLGAAARVERDQNGKPNKVTGINWDITELKTAQQSLQHLSDMQNILMDISMRYINIPLESISDAIQEALEKMGEFVGVDRAYIFKYDFAQETTSNTYEWCNTDIEPQIAVLQNIPLDHISDWVTYHKKGIPMLVPDVSALPDGSLKNILSPQNIKSLVTVPMIHGDSLIGFVGFDAVRNQHVFSKTELTLLNLFAQVLVNIQMRSIVEGELHKRESHERLLLNSMAEGLYGIDTNGNCTFANPSCLKLLGYTSSDQLLGKNMHDLIHHSHPDGSPFAKEDCAIFRAFQKGEHTTSESEVFWKADGSPFFVEYWSIPEFVNGKIVGAVISFSDISERKRMQESLADSRRRLANILEGTNVGTWEWNVQTGEVVFNERWANMLGYTLEELQPTTINTWSMLAHPEDLANSSTLIERHFSGELDYYECEARLRHKDGSWIWVLDRGKLASRTADGKPLLMSGTHQDITERKNNEERIKHLATHDTLTDLPTMRLARDRLLMAISLSKRNKNLTAIMFIDLDGFKHVNDTLGHDAGDHILKHVAAELQSCLRETDTVARIGGDEFLLVATGIHSEEDARALAEKALRLVSTEITIHGATARVGASIGISLFPSHGEDINQLIKLADTAMYKVKTSGKNGIEFA